MNRADRIDILFKDEKDYNDFLDDHYDREHVAGMGYDSANNMWRAQTDKWRIANDAEQSYNGISS